MARSKRTPTTTTYAILGQLAWGEATTYELVKAMRRNLRFMWPRAESRIYEEAKRLVEAGLVAAHEGSTGQRKRTVYSITDAGLAALREWLASPAGPISLENEPLLRVFLGGRARPEDLLVAVAAVRAHAEEMLAIGTPLAQEYLEGRHPQQHEVHLRALSFDYLYRWALLNREWADSAEAEIARWPDEEKQARALARIRAVVQLSSTTESPTATRPGSTVAP
jgi:DNA-binding PadR family transcriptional regulator